MFGSILWTVCSPLNHLWILSKRLRYFSPNVGSPNASSLNVSFSFIPIYQKVFGNHNDHTFIPFTLLNDPECTFLIFWRFFQVSLFSASLAIWVKSIMTSFLLISIAYLFFSSSPPYRWRLFLHLCELYRFSEKRVIMGNGIRGKSH